MDYFSLLNLPSAFDMGLPALESAYFKAQRQYHPDRFVGKPPAERQAALQCSVDINQAYNTLKNPLLRAQYMLHLQGIEIGTEQDTVKPARELLMESMEWRESITEAQNVQELQQLDNSLSAMIAQSIDHIAASFRDTAWEPMAHETLRLGYLLKAQEAIMQQKKRQEKRA